MPDAGIVEAIRQALAGSPFHGEGYRKVWARLRLDQAQHLDELRENQHPAALRDQRLEHLHQARDLRDAIAGDGAEPGAGGGDGDQIGCSVLQSGDGSRAAGLKPSSLAGSNAASGSATSGLAPDRQRDARDREKGGGAAALRPPNGRLRRVC
jgi:hypothetical protein